ncbi:bZIP transcription factor 27-like [Cornus florida]|uniref:bZIP transcription factor 27-like n=1 Tax=Cornus florida TaxID=4283 RepID=UPI002898B96D|nr:bZIP transcription factor 27-like [Cornus florida]
MWSSSSGANNISSSTKAISTSPLSAKSSSAWTTTTTSSSSTTPSPSSQIFPPPPSTPTTTRKKSMEEVWEDINTHSSLHHHPTTASAAAFQDFLTRAFNKDPPTMDDYFHHQPSSAGGGGARGPPPRPTTVLSLNSGLDYPKNTTADHLRSNPQVVNHGIPSFWPPLQSLASSTAVFSSLANKRPPQNDHDSRDLKVMRLIKNRDSAARSRARKQAYINELEEEVAHLVGENAKLRKQLLRENLYKKSCLAAPSQLPKKQSLSRSLTAPF